MKLCYYKGDHEEDRPDFLKIEEKPVPLRLIPKKAHINAANTEPATSPIPIPSTIRGSSVVLK